MKQYEIPQIRIETDGVRSEIFINGKKLEGVVGYRFNHDKKERDGLPRLQLDLLATNVTLNATMLPALPEPLSSHYLPINALIISEDISNDVITRLCRERGIDLEII